MSPLMPLATALLLGMQHALEVDHLVAVTTFVNRRPTLRSAATFGARWGFGHAAAVLTFGGVLLATGFRLAPRLEALGELLVGVMLIYLGAKAVRSGARHHGSEAAHQHTARTGVTWVGLTHGLAGTSAVVALVPALLGSRLEGFGYLLAFGLGTVAAMSTAAVVAALAVRRARQHSRGWSRAASMMIGWLAVAVGVVWVVRAALSMRPST